MNIVPVKVKGNKGEVIGYEQISIPEIYCRSCGQLMVVHKIEEPDWIVGKYTEDGERQYMLILKCPNYKHFWGEHSKCQISQTADGQNRQAWIG